MLNKLKPNPKNPRSIKKGEFESLKNKIRLFPEMLEKRPIVYDGDTVLGGNQRLKALKELEKEGLEIKDSYFADASDWSDEKKRQFVITDNISDGGWDYEILASEWGDLPLDEWGLKGTEWQKDTVEDEPPALPEGEGESKYGEVYQLGKHRLLCGDAAKLDDVKKLMGDEKANMVFTDPPYNVDYKQKGRGIKNDKFKSSQGFYQFLYDCIGAFRSSVLGDVYICMSSSELHTLQKAFVDNKGHWSTFIIWVKDRFTLGRSNYHRQYEPILYGWFEGSSHWWSGNRNLGDVYKENMAMGDDGQVWLKADILNGDIWEFPKPVKNREHPTMKPQALCARGIKNSSKVGDIVLDVFGGSGSTLIAAEQTERVCYMMELDPRYCDVIRKRYDNFVKGL